MRPRPIAHGADRENEPAVKDVRAAVGLSLELVTVNEMQATIVVGVVAGIVG